MHMSSCRIAALIVLLIMIVTSTSEVLASSTATAMSNPPPEETFQKSAVDVTPGSAISFHWANDTSGSYDFLLLSPTPNNIPNFSSPSVVSFPAGAGATYNSTWQWWQTSANTSANGVSIAIPGNAANGTIYDLELITCDPSTGLCSNANGGGIAEVTLTVSTDWTIRPVSSDYATVTVAQNSGHDLCTGIGFCPLDVTFGPNNTIFNSFEVSNSLGETPNSSTSMVTHADPYDNQSTPFALCVTQDPCTFGASSYSQLGERIIYADNLVWFTQGGYNLYPTTATVPNNSEIVAYDPNTGGFCTYGVPGGDTEVVGLAATGTGTSTQIWFVEQDPNGTSSNNRVGGPAIGVFSPSQVGESCSNYYPLAGQSSFQQILWTGGGAPSQIVADPNGGALWVTSFFSSQVDEFNIATHAVTKYSFQPRNVYQSSAYFGAEPWQLVADSQYVYAIDYGDSNLIRINKVTGAIDQVPIPLTADTEDGYGLALSQNGNKLYFTLNGQVPPTFGPASTFGYINIANWEYQSNKCATNIDCVPYPPARDAVLYSGLSGVTDPGGAASYFGIATGAKGEIAIADRSGVVRLVP